MAEVLTQWPEGRKGRPMNGMYRQFLDGQIWLLTNGVDFHLKNFNSAQNAFRLTASRMGLGLSVRKVSLDPLVIAVQSRPKR